MVYLNKNRIKKTLLKNHLIGLIDLLFHRHIKNVALFIKFVDENEMIKINSKYRGQPKTTNILSFKLTSSNFIKDKDEIFFCDLILCTNVIEREIKNNKLNPFAYWAHLIIHGILHLLGYDHLLKKDSSVMERVEMILVSRLNAYRI